MTEPPVDPVSPPEGLGPAVPDDALSALLNTVRLRGQQVFRDAVAAGDSVPQHDGPLLHIVEEGTARVIGDVGPVDVVGGDLILLPRGAAHRFTSPGAFRWVTGTITYESSAASERLLATLPPVVIVRFAADDPREWLEVSARLLLQEIVDPLPGASVMVSRIVDLLFVQALRAWARTTTEGPSWLSAAMDPHLGQVISALHRGPELPWTVASMAAAAHLSRSTFAQRFTDAVGMAPMAYLAERRFDRAAELLADTATPVHRVAALCGYASEPAFSRAFKRHLGMSPLHWRRQHQARA